MGYTGGTLQNPSYHHLEGHSEAVQIDYDPAVIGYADLLEHYFATTTPTRPAFSRQYADVIFVADADERARAERALAKAERRVGQKLHVEVLPAGRFWNAEDYHQKYYLRNTRSLMRELEHLPPERFRESTAAARLNGYIGGYGDPALLAREVESYGLSQAAREALTRHVTTKGRRLSAL